MFAMNFLLFLLLLLSALLAASLANNVTDPAAYFDDVVLTPSEKEGYATWLSSLPVPYDTHTFLPSENGDDGAAVFWTLDEEDGTIQFAVAVRADEGWVGFGLSEAGGMIGSDVAMFQSSSPDEVTDSHVVEDRVMPLVDACQDWNLTNATLQDGWTIVELRRALHTRDPQDHPIVDDRELWNAPTRLVAAWGDGGTASYHGESKARGSVRLFADASVPESAALERALGGGSDGHFDVRENEYVIPAVETDYRDLCRTFDELDVPQEGGITMIGAIPVITEETRPFVHHFTVYLVPECSEFAFPRSMIYVWAPGDQGWALPPNVGFPMFHDANARAIHVQIHYNNPNRLNDLSDSSGVRFYYVNEEREERAAILELGDPNLGLFEQAINPGLTKYQFTCPGECSAAGGGESVTILNEFLHMHQTGVRMTNEVVRDGKVVHASSVDVYDFEQQGGYHVPQQPFELLRGDGFRTTCYYRDGGMFGLGSNEEMCIAFVMYYPAREVAGYPWMCSYDPFIDLLSTLGCEQQLQVSDLDSVDGLGRGFGTSSECAVDSDLLLPSPTVAPTTSGQPTSSAKPSIDLTPCTVCPNGITADSDYVIPDSGGSTCEGAISYIKTTMLEGSDSCADMKVLEAQCCPTLAGDPCKFCSGGLNANAAFLEVPGAAGATCNDLAEYVPFLENESKTCSDIMLAEPLCCPGGDGGETTETCSFCETGLVQEPDYVIPLAPNGETCGDLTAIAPTLLADSEFCPQIKLAEPVCCPPTENIGSPASPNGSPESMDTTPTESIDSPASPDGSPESMDTTPPTMSPTKAPTTSLAASPEVANNLEEPSAGAAIHGKGCIIALIFAPFLYAANTVL